MSVDAPNEVQDLLNKLHAICERNGWALLLWCSNEHRKNQPVADGPPVLSSIGIAGNRGKRRPDRAFDVLCRETIVTSETKELVNAATDLLGAVAIREMRERKQGGREAQG